MWVEPGGHVEAAVKGLVGAEGYLGLAGWAVLPSAHHTLSFLLSLWLLLVTGPHAPGLRGHAPAGTLGGQCVDQ